MRASDAVAFAGRCCNYEKCPLRRFTRLSTGPALSLRMEGLAASDLRLCEMAQNRFTVQPLHGTQDDSSHRVVGTERTNKGQGAPFQEASHNQRHTNPIPEKEGVHGPQRDLARRPTASQRAARARAVCSGREDGTASGRGLTRDYAHARLPRTSATLAVHSVYLHDRARAAPARAAPQKEWPSHPPTSCPTPAPT